MTVFFFVFYNDEEGVLLCGGDFFASSEPTIRCPSVQRPFSMQWPFSIFIINVFFLICFQKISQTNAKDNWTPFLAIPCPNTVSTPSQHRINTVPSPTIVGLGISLVCPSVFLLPAIVPRYILQCVRGFPRRPCGVEIIKKQKKVVVKKKMLIFAS